MSLSHPTVRLNDGSAMPALGLGMWRLREGREARRAVGHALDAGYRLFDSASYYGNERSLGQAVRDSGVPRDEVFVTTKLWNSDHGHDAALQAFGRSKERLGLGPVDLYLIHWPVRGRRRDSWRALETLLHEGEVRAIGVSNYLVPHLEELLDEARVVPAVNQIELHPFCYGSRKATVDLCRRHGIAVEAYSPLTKGHRLQDPRLRAIATATGRTPAQVLLRWGLQHGFVEIPKSSHPTRIRENADVFEFELSQEEMEALDALDEALATGWDPTDEP